MRLKNGYRIEVDIMDKWLDEYVEKIMSKQVVKNAIFSKPQNGTASFFSRLGRAKTLRNEDKT